jgi:hypothetical protein
MVIGSWNCGVFRFMFVSKGGTLPAATSAPNSSTGKVFARYLSYSKDLRQREELNFYSNFVRRAIGSVGNTGSPSPPCVVKCIMRIHT